MGINEVIDVFLKKHTQMGTDTQEVYLGELLGSTPVGKGKKSGLDGGRHWTEMRS